jgi:HD-GYP domain-containing protein (c-di-GMP phosphodiesterase class II)
MKALLVESQPDRREIISLLLESEFHISTKAVSNFEEALHKLLDEEGIDLIVCEDTESTTKLFKYLASVQSITPIIILKNTEPVMPEAFPDLKFVGIVEYTNLKDGLIKTVSAGIQDGKIKGSSHDVDYCRVNTDLLMKVVPLEADVYIRLSDEKFIKMFRKGSKFTSKDAERYLEKKNIRHLFIHKSQSKEFLNRLTSVLDDVLKGKDKSVTLIESYPESLHQAVHSLWNQLGFSEPVQQLAKKSVEVVLQTLDKMPSLAQILKELQKKDKDYISNHSMAVGSVACSLAAKLKWSSETTFSKLTYAAMFHDIALPNDHIAHVGNTPDWRKDLGHLGTAERKIVVNHPTNTALLVTRFKELPPDVDVIIREHHERPSGKGYPQGLPVEKIAPLSAVFIFAHDLVDYSLAGGDLTDLQKFLAKYDYVKMHTQGTFHDILISIDADVFKRKKAA